MAVVDIGGPRCSFGQSDVLVEMVSKSSVDTSWTSGVIGSKNLLMSI